MNTINKSFHALGDHGNELRTLVTPIRAGLRGLKGELKDTLDASSHSILVFDNERIDPLFIEVRSAITGNIRGETRLQVVLCELSDLIGFVRKKAKHIATALHPIAAEKINNEGKLPPCTTTILQSKPLEGAEAPKLTHFGLFQRSPEMVERWRKSFRTNLLPIENLKDDFLQLRNENDDGHLSEDYLQTKYIAHCRSGRLKQRRSRRYGVHLEAGQDISWK